MDFKSTYDRDAKFQRIAHTCTMLCLCLTGGIMLATLVLSPANTSEANMVSISQR